MALPPPNTDPQLAGPMRFADQNRRLKQKEGQALPTPRTYRYNPLGSTPASTTGSVTVGSIDIVLQPREIIGFMAIMEARRNNTDLSSFSLTVDSPFSALLDAQVIRTTALGSASGAWDTYHSPLGMYSSSLTPTSEFVWLTDRRNTPITTTQKYTIDIKFVRDSGTAAIDARNLDLWVMVL